jgi:release factor glutamine methyltransferase
VTVLEAIQKGSDFLGRKGVEQPRLHSELLLSHVLKLKRLHLYLEFGKTLSTEEADRFREMLQRRGRREPLQHIVEGTSFCGLELQVNRHVLVPRPETEVLAEEGWTYLQRRASQNLGTTFLDFATGSGCIALAILRQCAAAAGFAVDVAPEALRTARENTAALGVADRLTLLESDGFAAIPADLRLDLIVSNPPYIPSAEIETLQPEVREYDPRLALDGGGDGLMFYRMLARESPRFLASDGRMMIEFGDGQDAAISHLLETDGWTVDEVKPDLSGRPRVLIARRKCAD